MHPRFFFLCLIVNIFTTTSACDPTSFLTINVQWYETSTSVPESVYSWSGLMDFKQAYKIVVSDQNIKVICQNSVTNLPRLVILNLDRNNINEIKPNTFQNVSSLREVSLMNNSLKVIEEGTFNNLGLATLKLDGNSITDIDQRAFDNMTNLRSLHLSRNKLKFIDNHWFKNSSELEFLNLEYNEIISLPEFAFQNLKGKHVFPQYDVYLILLLNNNHIKYVDPNAFRKLDGIGELMLENNEILELPEDIFKGFKFMNTFSVSFNNLSCLPKNLENVLIATDVIFLDSNPFICKCAMQVKNYADAKSLNVQMEYSLSNCKEESSTEQSEESKKV